MTIKDLQSALQEALVRAYNDNGKFEYWVERDGKAVTPAYSAQGINQWDYTEEELENMDWWLCAGEVIENLGIEADERPIYIVKQAPKS